MQYAQFALAALPVNLVCIDNGRVAFVVVETFKGIIDQAPAGGVGAMFFMERFSIGTNELAYNTSYAYKEMPDVLQWLQQMNLQIN